MNWSGNMDLGGRKQLGEELRKKEVPGRGHGCEQMSCVEPRKERRNVGLGQGEETMREA